MFGLFAKRPSKPQPGIEQLVPRIKHRNFLEAVRPIAAKDPASMPLVRPLIADLLITYAFDLPGAFMMAREVDQKRLKLSLDQIHAASVANLRKQLGRIQQRGKSPIFQLAVGNNLDACLLLYDEVWRKTAQRVPGRLVVSVPSRDVVLFTSSEWPAGLDAIRKMSAEARSRQPVHGLSECLLAWVDGAWEEFEKGR